MYTEGGGSARRARAGHLSGPLLIRSPDPRFCMASGWGEGPALFQLGIWTGPCPVGDMDPLLSGWGYGLAPFQLGIWTGPFPIEDMHWPLSSW